MSPSEPAISFRELFAYTDYLANPLIQAILRHTDVATTQRFYINTVREDGKDAMKQLERKIHRAAVVQQAEPTGLVN
jgi:integrase